jgi:uncharacterized protein
VHPGTRADRLASALDEFVRSSPDVEAAAVVSFDGLPMASALPDDLEEDRLGAMSAALLSLGEQAAIGLGRGELNQIFVEGEHGFVFLMSARDQAVLTAVAARTAKIGFMLFEMRRAADRIGGALEGEDSPVVAPEASVSSVPAPEAAPPADVQPEVAPFDASAFGAPTAEAPIAVFAAAPEVDTPLVDLPPPPSDAVPEDQGPVPHHLAEPSYHEPWQPEHWQPEHGVGHVPHGDHDHAQHDGGQHDAGEHDHGHDHGQEERSLFDAQVGLHHLSATAD